MPQFKSKLLQLSALTAGCTLIACQTVSTNQPLDSFPVNNASNRPAASSSPMANDVSSRPSSSASPATNASSPSQSQTSSQTTGTVTGRIINKDTQLGEPGVTVQAGSISALTDADGNYTLENVPVYTRRLQARKSGYGTPTEISIGVKAGETVSATSIQMTRLYWSRQMSGTSANLNDLYFLDAQTAWIAGDDGTVLKTRNGGESWDKMSVPAFDYMGVHFLNEQKGFLNTSDGRVLKTTDGGLNWEERVLAEKGLRCSSYHGDGGLKFLDEQTGYAWCQKLFRTSDAGETWQESTSYIHTFDFWNSLQGIAFSQDQTLITMDGGENWQKSTRFNTTPTGMQYINENNLAAIKIGSRSIDFSAVFLKSTDKGLSWQSQVLPFDNDNSYIDFYFIDDLNGWIIAGGKPTGAGYYFEPIFLMTRDGGQSWIKQESTLHSPKDNRRGSKDKLEIKDMQFLDRHTGWAVGAQGVILKY